MNLSGSQSGSDPVGKLVFELSKLPGIGEKTATRLAYFIVRQSNGYAESLSDAISAAKTRLKLCETCQNFTQQSPCHICRNPERSTEVICVLEKPSDIHPIENTGFNGRFHVLHGILSPLDGIGPDELKIKELLERLRDSTVREVIIATNPSVEGEATAIYLSKLIQPLGVRVTQLAHGLPMGGTLEYSDRQTISKAIENRLEID